MGADEDQVRNHDHEWEPIYLLTRQVAEVCSVCGIQREWVPDGREGESD